MAQDLAALIFNNGKSFPTRLMPHVPDNGAIRHESISGRFRLCQRVVNSAPAVLIRRVSSLYAELRSVPGKLLAIIFPERLDQVPALKPSKAEARDPIVGRPC